MVFIKKLSYAARGLFKIILRETSVRIHLTAGLLVLALAVYWRLPATETAILIIIIIFIVTLEGLNNILERVVDLAEPRFKEIVRDIKDALAGLVMLASLGALVSGLIIFWPYLFF